MYLLKSLSFLFLLFGLQWNTNLEDAKKEAVEKNKKILLNFSGSDWCVNCIKMEKNIFKKKEFETFAKDNLVLVNADFPQDEAKLADKQRKYNEGLAEKYNPTGHFPFTLLLDASGNIIYSWDGYPKGKMEDFLETLKNECSK